MRCSKIFIAIFVATSLNAILAVNQTSADDVASNRAVDYQRDIKPLLAKSCTACHGALKQESGLRLDTRNAAVKGGDTGAVISVGKANESALIERVTAEGDERMPPEGEGEALTAKEVALLKSWIDAGANGPADEPVPADPRLHWAYQLPQRATVPTVEGVSHPIDAFLAHKRNKANLRIAEPASDRVWLRRVYFDFIGLPPTPDEVADFLADDSNEARTKVIDRLLKSKRHGERWGRHWMDVWRYSDWSGYKDQVRNSQRHIWRWRDWIIQSVNDDKPYDAMVREMLAGDEIDGVDHDKLAATGFLARNWYKFNRNTWLDSTVEHTAKAFLATTMNCAKCHDHKYDPISQENYYQLRAFFEPHNTRTDQVGFETDLMKDGLPRAYDADLETPTYIFTRGNEKHPQKDNPLSPGLPAVLQPNIEIQSVQLPTLAYYPYLQEHQLASFRKKAENDVTASEQQLASARAKHQASQKALTEFSQPKEEAKEEAPTLKSGDAFIVDDFSKQRDDLWKRIGGKWKFENGRFHQSDETTSRSELVSRKDHPQDFIARFRFKIIGGKTYHSVGLSFDGAESSRQTVYLSAHSPQPKLQVSHSANGADNYPPAGRVALKIERGEEYELQVAVRDRLMNVFVDGKLQLAYETPLARTTGKFSLWTFDSAADFLHAEVMALPTDFKLTKSAKPAPLATKPKTKAEQQAAVEQALHELRIAELKVEQSQLARQYLAARIAADRSKYNVFNESKPTGETTFDELALAAGALKQQLAVINAKVALQTSSAALRKAKLAAEATGAKKEKDVLAKATQANTKQQAALKTAEANVNKPTKEYEPLGKEFPRTSTGRRLALANWIADRNNPLTARVIVNHIWLRHFGSALVENSFDFGLRSPQPLHHELLDWLAVEFMENGWSMKHIHRLIVSSQTYAMSSRTSAYEHNHKIDPDNHYFWKANVRRLEAEVVRDSILYVAGNLNLEMGGPEIAQNLGQANRRRSVYFRHAYEKKMKFLELFDAANETDCYRRSESIVPQQALAMSNSQLSFSQSRLLARELSTTAKTDADFINLAFERTLGRPPTELEIAACQRFLNKQTERLINTSELTKFDGGAGSEVPPSTDAALRSREGLVHTLMNHNDFLTVR